MAKSFCPPYMPAYTNIPAATTFRINPVVVIKLGVWIPLLAVPNDDRWFWYVIAAFALFRIFDIAKPLGKRRMESLKGGVGVMMDDVLAGVYSFILLVGARWVIG